MKFSFQHHTGAATTVREVIAYRRESEQYLGQDEHLYRVEWVRACSHDFALVSLF